MTLIIAHGGPYDFFLVRNQHMLHFHWGYFDLKYTHLSPNIAIPALTEAMKAPRREGEA